VCRVQLGILQSKKQNLFIKPAFVASISGTHVLVAKLCYLFQKKKI